MAAPNMIRPARASDLKQIIAIVDAAFAPYVPLIGRRPAPLDADYAALIADGMGWVLCRDDDAPVGMMVLRVSGPYGALDTVAIHPAHHGQGLGRLLITAAEERTRAAGHRWLRLYTNAAMAGNLTLYPRLGFVETHRREQDGFQRVFYEKDLGAPGDANPDDAPTQNRVRSDQ